MGIYISRTELPQEGTVVVIDSTGQVWSNEWPTRGYTRIDGAKAVPVPPHGILIDADALLKDDSRKYDAHIGMANGRDTTLADSCHRAIQWTIEDAPTIIPASEEVE